MEKKALLVVMEALRLQVLSLGSRLNRRIGSHRNQLHLFLMSRVGHLHSRPLKHLIQSRIREIRGEVLRRPGWRGATHHHPIHRE